MKNYPPSFWDWLERHHPWTDEFRWIEREFKDIITNQWRVVYRHIYN